MKFRRNEVDIKKFTIDKEKIEKFKDDMSYNPKRLFKEEA